MSYTDWISFLLSAYGKLLMRVYAYFLMIFTFSLGYSIQGYPQFKTNKGLCESVAFTEYINTYDTPDTIRENNIEFFTLLGEGEFLFDNSLDFYFLYLFSESGDSAMTVFSLHEKRGTILATKRFLKNVNECSCKKNENGACISEVYSKLASRDDIAAFKSFANNIVSTPQEKASLEYDAPFQVLFIFDGSDYFIFTPFNMDSKRLGEVDVLFKGNVVKNSWFLGFILAEICFVG